MTYSALRQAGSRLTFYYLAVLTGILCIAGCAAGGDPPPPNTILTFIAAEPVNHGSPLKITVVQLSHKTRFLAADYYDLQQDVDRALAEHLLGKDELFLLPAEDKKILTLDPVAGARYVAMFAEYKHPVGSGWRRLLVLPVTEEPSMWTKLWPGRPADPGWTISVTPAGLQPAATVDGAAGDLMPAVDGGADREANA